MYLFNVSETEYNWIKQWEYIELLDEVIGYSENWQKSYSEKVNEYLSNWFEVWDWDHWYIEHEIDWKKYISKRLLKPCFFCLRKELTTNWVEVTKGITYDEIVALYDEMKLDKTKIKSQDEITDDELKQLEKQYKERLE